MRAAALVAITAVGLAAITGLAGAQSAATKTVTDPNGRVAFETPRNWTVTNERADGFTHITVGVAAQECAVLAFPSQNLANVTPRDAKRTGANSAQFTQQFWTTSANAVGPVFPANSAQVQSTSLDESGFWPIQRAEIRNAERLVHASLTIRPGMEIYSYCQTYEGADAVATYEALSRSIRHPNDATWQAEAERAQAERDATVAANAASAATPATPITRLQCLTAQVVASGENQTLSIANGCSMTVKVYWAYVPTSGANATGVVTVRAGRNQVTEAVRKAEYVASCPDNDRACNGAMPAAATAAAARLTAQ